MSATLTFSEPYRLPAGMLALAVHLLFFLVLYSGFRWQAQPPEEFMVEMWESLPDVPVLPEQEQTPKTEAPAQPKALPPVLPPVKAEIEIRDKKAKEKKRAEEKKAAAKARQEKEERELNEYVSRRVLAEQTRVRAEVDAATATQVGRYQDMIRAKIRSKIVMPPDVPDTARAEFKVTLLPGGDVLDVELLHSSGHTAYDSAAERAIYKAQPLPVPSEEDLQKMFRELRLTIRP